LQATLFSVFLLCVSSLAIVDGRSRMMSPLYSFPETRRGRATPPGSPHPVVPSAVNDPEQAIMIEEPQAEEDSFLDKMLDEEQVILYSVKSVLK
jgi:hypothetical protein